MKKNTLIFIFLMGILSFVAYTKNYTNNIKCCIEISKTIVIHNINENHKFTLNFVSK